MLRRRFRCFTAALRFAALLSILPVAGSAQFLYTYFDAPGANPVDQGTLVGGINNNGDVAGVVVDATGLVSGFIRTAASGTISVFGLPTPCIQPACSGRITGINDSGAVVGYFGSGNPSISGFIRAPDGTYTVFQGPDGGAAYTSGLNNANETIINPPVIVGTSYLRSAAGTLTALPAPANLSQPEFTAINNNGQVAGSGIGDGVNYPAHLIGYVLDVASGQFTYFDYSTSTANFLGTDISGLADNGAVTGTLDGATSFVGNPVSNPAGSPLIFVAVVPGGVSQPFGINSAGTITGSFQGYGPDFPIRGFIGVPTTDTTPPTVSLLNIVAGPPEQAVFSVVDPAGLLSVTTQSSNATVTVTPISPGQTTPATVTATKTDQSEKTYITIFAEDVAGNQTTFDPAFVTVDGTGGSQADSLTNVPPGEHVLTVNNANPGLDRLRIVVNQRTVVLPLKSGETRTLNLRAWMTLGSNSLSFSGEGPANSSASLVLKDGAVTPTRK